MLDFLKLNRKKFNCKELANYCSKINCDFCNEDLFVENDSFYILYDYFICFDCKENKEQHYNNMVLIDRLNYSIEQKPLVWKCNECEQKLGGGHKWYVYKNNIDFCMNCVSNKDDLYNLLMEKCQFISNDINYCCIDRLSPILLNVKYDDDKDNFDVPNEIQNLITEEKDNNFLNSIGCFVFCDLDKNNSLLKWTIFEDYMGIDFYNASTALAIKCEFPYPIASCCEDDHGRISFDVIYNSFEDYKKDLSLWIKPSENELKKQTEKNKKFLKEGECSDENCLLGSKSFSEYIRFKKDLSFYFG